MLFRDRSDAGRMLAAKLAGYAGHADVVVLALPRGGVPVGFEVASWLAAPLDVFVVRKLGVPGQEELAMGALASGGVRVLNQEVIRQVSVSPRAIQEVSERENRELRRRELLYRGGRPPPEVRGKNVILIDDGLATGFTMRAAVAALRQRAPTHITVAAPVAAAPTCDELRGIADEVICLETPYPFFAVGLWYEEFSQTTDEEVRTLLDRSREATGVSAW